MASAVIPNLSADGYTRFNDETINLSRNLRSEQDGKNLFLNHLKICCRVYSKEDGLNAVFRLLLSSVRVLSFHAFKWKIHILNSINSII